MEPLSPRTANIPLRTRVTMKKTKVEVQTKAPEKVVNKDKIEDKWRPAPIIAEPGSDPEVYHTGRKLGKGGFAVCFEGTLKRTGQVFAMKVVRSYVEQKKQLEKFRTELQIHSKMRHPNIVEFYRAFSFEEYTYVVLELCPNGSLMDMVKSRSCLSLPEVRRYMIQLCGGVKYMHQRAVIHRDLKMGNLFLDAKMDLKIGDFGLAAIVVSEKERRQTLCGTPNYIAPEILDKKSSGGHDHKVDTWAIGIICYAMLTGGPPFASKTQPEIYAKLKQLEYSWKTDGMNYISPQVKDLVASCLNLTAHDRPEMDDLVDHEFFKMGSIAENLSPDCRSEIPGWLEKADPRGDRVRVGYGVPHEVICAACGVGKLPAGINRPSVGENTSRSALTEVEIENKQGLAPIVPLPAGFLYKQFTAAKEDWTISRKYPVSSMKVRGRKNVSKVDSMDMDSVSKALPDITTTATFSLPTRAPIQSFAAQQRQAAVGNRVTSRTLGRHLEQSAAVEIRVKEDPPTDIDTARGYLRERPVRSTSGMSTRNNSTRDEVTMKTTLTKSTTISEGVGRKLKSQMVSSVEEVSPELPRAATLGRSAVTRGTLRTNLGSSSSTKSSSSSDSKEHEAPDLSREREPKLQSLAQLRPRPMTKGKSTVLDPSEHTSLLRSSRPRDVLALLRAFRESLSGVQSTSGTRIRGPATAPPIVEKWVDYTGKYGIAYILSDNTVGCVFNSSEDNNRPASCIVLREGRQHYVQQAQKSTSNVVHQLLPSNGWPIEFYEYQESEGLRKAVVPAAHFSPDKQAAGDKMSSDLNDKLHTRYDREKFKLVMLCDKFGKYMTKTLSRDELEPEDITTRGAARGTSQIFLKFYQRLGNVGVWGFSSSSSAVSATESTAFQFNFPDHTKLVLYENGTFLDLYHLQAADAIQLSRTGSLSSRALERRRMMTLRTADVLLKPTGSATLSRTTERDILAANQVEQKLAWIRDLVEVWIREGGLGRVGSADGRLWWKGLQEGGRRKLVWVTVGREGGDKGSFSRAVGD